MNEQEFGRTLAGHLNRGLTQINRDALDRLGQARERALAAYQEPVDVPEMALSAGHGMLSGRGRARKGRYAYLLPVLLLLAALTFAFYWQSAPLDDNIDDVADIDARLLGGDLPIQAYLDTSMDSWLENSADQ